MLDILNFIVFPALIKIHAVKLTNAVMLTFRNLAFHIWDGHKITLYMPHFIFIQQISVLNILNMLYNFHFFLFKMPFIS